MKETIATRALTFQYGETNAVDGVSLRADAGDVVGVVGPNGAGKSTLLSLMAGLLAPTSGAVTVEGAELTAKANDVRRRIGYCPQRPLLWPDLTCMEQLVFMAELYGIKAREARERAMVQLRALGLGGRENHRSQMLSGGMQQRLSVGMALVHDPCIVLLDEPEAGLDPATLDVVRTHLHALARDQGKTIIYSTHDIEGAEAMCGRIALLKAGRLLAYDTPARLLEASKIGPQLELRFARLPSDGESVVRYLETFGAVRPAGDLRYRLAWSRPSSSLATLREELGAHGLDAREIRLREPGLADVYDALTRPAAAT